MLRSGSQKATLISLLVIVAGAGVMLGTRAGISIEEAQSADQDSAAEPTQLVRGRALALTAAMIYELTPPVGPLTFSLSADEVRVEPGSCVTYPPEGQPRESEADYMVVVKAHTFFGIPLRRFRVTCGGNAIA